jgi:FKBP-type peptidyl-prolyl cis-trans isomerase
MSPRRLLPLALAALVTLAACGGDDGDTIPEISLVPATEPVDLCKEEDSGGFEVAATVPETTEAAPSTAAVATTEPAATTPAAETSSPSDSSAPAGDTQPSGLRRSTASTQPAATTEPTDSSEPTGSSEPTESTEPSASSEPTGSTVDEFAEAPEVELPEETPTELVRTVLEEGPSDGPEAGEGDLVDVYYVGVLSADGTQFDSNYGTGSPFTVTLGSGGVIEGWEQGLLGAKPGDRLQLDIPGDLAYGEAGQPPTIPPDAALSFVIDVVDVVDVPEVELPEEVPTEVQTRVIEEGPSDGQEIKEFDTVNVYSLGVLTEDGTQFENNFGTDTPKPLIIGSADVPGLSEGLIGARPGDQLQIDIPADQGYGAAGSQEPAVPPDAALSYIIEVVDVVSPPAFEVPEEAPDEAVRTVLEEGDADGRVSQRFDTVDLDIIGVLIEDQTVWVSTFGRDQPVQLTVGQATGLAGLDDGIDGVRPGDVVQLDLPAAEAFGETGSSDGAVPPDAPITLVFEVNDVTGPPLFELPEEIPTEVEVTELEPGTGEPAKEGDLVFVNYTGVLSEDGTRFATNYGAEPYPVTLGAGDVIPGWDEGLVGATAGSQLRIDVPADAGYGDLGVPSESIPEGAALSFLIDVVAVIPASDASDAPTDLELPLTEEPLTEVVVDDVVVGDGAELTPGTTGYADVYTVCANNGVVIDNSYGAENRVQLPMQSGQGGLMEGLYQGLQGMKAGGQRIISVPAELALGQAGNLDLGIGANHDLIFVVDLYAVIDPTPPPPSTEPTESTEPTDSSEPSGSSAPTESTEPTATSAAPATSEPTATTEVTETSSVTSTDAVD